MPLCKNCPKTKKIYYTGNEKTPRGFGYIARFEKKGKKRYGKDGKLYIATDKKWIRVKSSREISPRLFGKDLYDEDIYDIVEGPIIYNGYMLDCLNGVYTYGNATFTMKLKIDEDGKVENISKDLDKFENRQRYKYDSQLPNETVPMEKILEDTKEFRDENLGLMSHNERIIMAEIVDILEKILEIVKENNEVKDLVEESKLYDHEGFTLSVPHYYHKLGMRDLEEMFESWLKETNRK